VTSVVCEPRAVPNIHFFSFVFDCQLKWGFGARDYGVCRNGWESVLLFVLQLEEVAKVFIFKSYERLSHKPGGQCRLSLARVSHDENTLLSVYLKVLETFCHQLGELQLSLCIWILHSLV